MIGLGLSVLTCMVLALCIGGAIALGFLSLLVGSSPW